MPIKTLRPGVDPQSLTPKQKEAILHAYVFGTQRPPLFSPLDLENLVKVMDPTGGLSQLAQAQKLYKAGQTHEAMALLKKLNVKGMENQKLLKTSVESLSALRKNP